MKNIEQVKHQEVIALNNDKINIIEVTADNKIVKNIFSEIDKRQYTPNVI